MTDLTAENKELRARLAEAEETIEAIRSGAVDALVTAGPAGEQVFTLQGAETPYRLLMESMNEGAATVARDGTVLYCNRRFAEMAGLPAEQVVGASIFQCVVPEEEPRLRELLTQVAPGGSKAEFTFSRAADPGLPALLSLSPIAMDAGPIAVLATDLSERKRFEHKLNQLNEELEERVGRRTTELQESEKRYRLLFDKNPDGVVAVDTKGRFVLANPACEVISGYSITELLQKTFQELCAPDRLGRAVEYFERGVRQGAAQGLEVTLLRNDGRRVQVWVAGELVALGDQLVLQCTVKDITELKQAERAKFAANQRLQALMQALPVGVSFSDDATCQHITGNPAALAQFEVTATDNLSASALEENAPGRHVRFFRDGQPMTDADLPLQRAVAENRQIPPMEFEVLLPSGRRWYAQACAAPIRDEQGKVVGGVAVTVDTTALKQAEAGLRESEARRKVAEAVQIEKQRLHDVMDMLPAYVVLLSADHQVPFANRFFEERFGKSEDRRCYEYLFNRTDPCENCESFKVFKDNLPHRWEWAGPDGRNYDIYDFPFQDVDGSPLVMEVGLDITERKKAEAELNRHREHLQELVRERTAKLNETNEELMRFNRAMVGRELRMIELKQEINCLCAALGRPPVYLQAQKEEPETPAKT